MMSFIVILDCALGAVLIGFNSWNWFLALTGMSTIEFWGQQQRVNIKDKFPITNIYSLDSKSTTLCLEV
jgi:hypothetical protein